MTRTDSSHHVRSNNSHVRSTTSVRLWILSLMLMTFILNTAPRLRTVAADAPLHPALNHEYQQLLLREKQQKQQMQSQRQLQQQAPMIQQQQTLRTFINPPSQSKNAFQPSHFSPATASGAASSVRLPVKSAFIQAQTPQQQQQQQTFQQKPSLTTQQQSTRPQPQQQQTNQQSTNQQQLSQRSQQNVAQQQQQQTSSLQQSVRSNAPVAATLTGASSNAGTVVSALSPPVSASAAATAASPPATSTRVPPNALAMPQLNRAHLPSTISALINLRQQLRQRHHHRKSQWTNFGGSQVGSSSSSSVGSGSSNGSQSGRSAIYSKHINLGNRDGRSTLRRLLNDARRPHFSSRATHAVRRQAFGSYASGPITIRQAIAKCLNVHLQAEPTFFTHQQQNTGTPTRLRFALRDPTAHRPESRPTPQWIRVYHGTKQQYLPSILKQGLIVGCTSNAPCANGKVKGLGVYTTPEIRVTDDYSTLLPCPDRTPDGRVMSLSVVLELLINPEHANYYRKEDHIPQPDGSTQTVIKPIIKVDFPQWTSLQALVVRTEFKQASE